MKAPNKIDISTLSYPVQSDFSPKSSENKLNQYKTNSYSQDKSNITNDNNNNVVYIKVKNNIDDNNIVTETSKINLIKNPPNLLKLCMNDDYDEYLKIHNENLKLNSELTLEKSKVIKLNNLLKDKEKENINLKLKIEELEINYQELVKEQKKYCEDKINSIFKEVSLDKNNLIETYDAIQRSKDKELSKINNEINNLYNIINLFFNFYNKKIHLLIKTGIISQKKSNSIILDNKFNNIHKNSIYIIKSLDELINKLFNDNKELYNELVNYRDFIKNNEITDKNKEIDEYINDNNDNDNYNNNNNNNNNNSYDFDKEQKNRKISDNNIEENKNYDKQYNTEKNAEKKNKNIYKNFYINKDNNNKMISSSYHNLSN